MNERREPDFDALAAEGWTLTSAEMEDLARGVLPAPFRTREDDRVSERAVNVARAESGMSVHVDKLKRTKTITVRISEVAFEGLVEIAAEHGFYQNGRGNVSGLIEAIGQGKLTVKDHTDSSLG